MFHFIQYLTWQIINISECVKQIIVGLLTLTKCILLSISEMGTNTLRINSLVSNFSPIFIQEWLKVTAMYAAPFGIKILVIFAPREKWIPGRQTVLKGFLRGWCGCAATDIHRRRKPASPHTLPVYVSPSDVTRITLHKQFQSRNRN